MKFTHLSIVLFSAISVAAFADIPASRNPMDFGISVGALNSKAFKIKAGKYDYAVISADLGEPACNSVQTVVTVTDDALEGEDPTVTYNLGSQVATITSVKAKGNQVIITARQNSPEDCSKHVMRTYMIQYKGSASNLEFTAK